MPLPYTNNYNTAGGSEPFPGLLWYLSCFIVLIISTAARPAVNNIFSAGVHQALNLYFTSHIKKHKPFHSANSIWQQQPNYFSACSGSTKRDSEVILAGENEHIRV